MGEITLNMEDIALALNVEHDLEKALLRKLMDEGLLNRLRVRNYLVAAQYNRYLVRHQGHAGRAIEEMSAAFGLTERQVQKIIYQRRGNRKEQRICDLG